MDNSNLQAELDDVIEKLRIQLANMSWEQIDKEATGKKIVDSQLRRVQSATKSAAKSALNGDRMEASKGVRVNRYKGVLGGNVNILTKRGRSISIDMREYTRSSRRYRSERTKVMQSSYGAFRSYVLRWLQAGTKDREAGTKYSSRGGRGNRGRITARDFMSTARSGMQTAADNVTRQLNVIMEKQFLKD